MHRNGRHIRGNGREDLRDGSICLQHREKLTLEKAGDKKKLAIFFPSGAAQQEKETKSSYEFRRVYILSNSFHENFAGYKFKGMDQSFVTQL